MQVRPWGQKKPAQQGRQSRVRKGIVFESCILIFWSPELHPQPGSQPSTHDVRLQLRFGFK